MCSVLNCFIYIQSNHIYIYIYILFVFSHILYVFSLTLFYSVFFFCIQSRAGGYRVTNTVMQQISKLRKSQIQKYRKQNIK